MIMIDSRNQTLPLYTSFVTLSAKTRIVHTTSEFFFIFSALSTVFKKWVFKISAKLG